MELDLLNKMVFNGDMTEEKLHELLVEFFYKLDDMNIVDENKYMLAFRKMRIFLNITLLEFDTIYNEYSLLLGKNHNINLHLIR